MADLVGEWELVPGERTNGWEKVTATISKADESSLTMVVFVGKGDCFGVCCMPRQS